MMGTKGLAEPNFVPKPNMGEAYLSSSRVEQCKRPPISHVRLSDFLYISLDQTGSRSNHKGAEMSLKLRWDAFGGRAEDCRRECGEEVNLTHFWPESKISDIRRKE
jgi:hypothetical protein